MTLGEKIKKIRIDKNFTQEHVAFELGISQKTYSNFENNKTSPSFIQIEQLASVLNANIIDFLTDEKIIFNQNTENGYNNGIVLYQETSHKLFEQFELRIKQLQEENNFLKELIRK